MAERVSLELEHVVRCGALCVRECRAQGVEHERGIAPCRSGADALEGRAQRVALGARAFDCDHQLLAAVDNGWKRRLKTGE